MKLSVPIPNKSFCSSSSSCCALLRFDGFSVNQKLFDRFIFPPLNNFKLGQRLPYGRSASSCCLLTQFKRQARFLCASIGALFGLVSPHFNPVSPKSEQVLIHPVPPALSATLTSRFAAARLWRISWCAPDASAHWLRSSTVCVASFSAPGLLHPTLYQGLGSAIHVSHQSTPPSLVPSLARDALKEGEKKDSLYGNVIFSTPVCLSEINGSNLASGEKKYAAIEHIAISFASLAMIVLSEFHSPLSQSVADSRCFRGRGDNARKGACRLQQGASTQTGVRHPQCPV